VELPSSDILTLIYALVPGFLAAWVFYGLTAHPRKTPFERTIQALIFTLFVQGMTFGVRWGLERIGGRYSVGPWTESAALFWSATNAVVIGLVFALFANKDWFHRFLRERIGLTKRTSFPSEWFSAFNRDKRFVILHLKGERRLHGWPEEWPDQPDCGHFVIHGPSWILDSNERAPLYLVERLLIPATEVEMVEILKDEATEVKATAEQLQAVETLLVGLQQPGEDQDGKQSTATPAEQANTPSATEPESDGKAPVQRIESAHVPAATAKETVKRERNRNRRK
jgi:hypothetical protein